MAHLRLVGENTPTASHHFPVQVTPPVTVTCTFLFLLPQTFCGLAYVPLVQTLKLRTHLIAALRQTAVMCSCGLWNENV